MHNFHCGLRVYVCVCVSQILEAMHVIDPSQIHVSVVPFGPSATLGGAPVALSTTYRNTIQATFQDSIGLALLQVSLSVNQSISQSV